MTEQLDAFPDARQDSPRLKWCKENALTTRRLENGRWRCNGKTKKPQGCTDGKTRRIKPEIFPLAHGVSGRVGLLRGSGNAIVPQTAAQFIQATLPRTGIVTLE